MCSLAAYLLYLLATYLLLTYCDLAIDWLLASIDYILGLDELTRKLIAGVLAQSTRRTL